MTSVIRILIWGLLAGSLAGPALAQDGRFESERERMVATQVEARDIRHPATLEALRRVPRHLFVPEDRRRHAYQDRPVPIGYGQTISQPFLVAYMTALLKPQPGMRVLEIGTGSGYQAAVLAEILDEVFTVEIIGELAQWGEANLRRVGYGHVRVKHGDGYHGWDEHAPFDAIVVTAAADHVPPPLLDQLRQGGRMVIPVGSPFRTQTLMLITRDGDRTVSESLLPVRFVPLTRRQP
ncbi:Protein-L-isoaspartate O-methyltransferase [Thioalkalivibrio nitratireducens DSM 14787]|uniref:Protein-L-isoaspartate O-methyltransferase n=1 Tax=Thioalkalivibrio nitratireducens (strain DSM 14787 / UNIQEM 213 / ALEN2) TaxID=1255043 RepID=L0DZG8_THIND|nr:protein-L-isoaspartate(D-aspartate) O-methyltransferase [Thioalkalivibrio nitratireducens]AGA34377.1 Protein-L-isoaspartate O-methyltransferase [Thioalkalivibrio nitratireducens DSM 14787]